MNEIIEEEDTAQNCTQQSQNATKFCRLRKGEAYLWINNNAMFCLAATGRFRIWGRYVGTSSSRGVPRTLPIICEKDLHCWHHMVYKILAERYLASKLQVHHAMIIAQHTAAQYTRKDQQHTDMWHTLQVWAYPWLHLKAMTTSSNEHHHFAAQGKDRTKQQCSNSRDMV